MHQHGLRKRSGLFKGEKYRHTWAMCGESGPGMERTRESDSFHAWSLSVGSKRASVWKRKNKRPRKQVPAQHGLLWGLKGEWLHNTTLPRSLVMMGKCHLTHTWKERITQAGKCGFQTCDSKPTACLSPYHFLPSTHLSIYPFIHQYIHPYIEFIFRAVSCSQRSWEKSIERSCMPLTQTHA